MSSAVPTTMPRPNVRCGSAVSPAENVTYCQPSYAQSTPIIPVIAPLTSAIEKCCGHQSSLCTERLLMATSSNASTMITPPFTTVATPCTSALWRVPRTLTAVTTAIIATEKALDAAAESGTNTPTYRGNAAASVAIDPLPMTRNIVHPYRNASSGPKASLKYVYMPPESGLAAPSSAKVRAPSSDSTPPMV